jgi:tetratricopeptide (TPR) repeat protein
LKQDASAQTFLAVKPDWPDIPATLWDITVLPAIKPGPNYEEFDYIVQKRGLSEALSTMRGVLKNDPDYRMPGYLLNGLGYSYLNKRQVEEALSIFKLNTELNPEDTNVFDSLAEGYEIKGDLENMKKVSATILALLTKKTTLNDNEKALKENAEKRLSQKVGQ